MFLIYFLDIECIDVRIDSSGVKLCVCVCVCVFAHILGRTSTLEPTEIGLTVICVHNECRYTLKDNKHDPVRAPYDIHRADQPYLTIKNQGCRVMNAIKP